MKKLLLSLLMVLSSSVMTLADDVDTKLFYYTSGDWMTCTSVSKAMLSMVSPEILKELPLLGSVEGVESIGIYSTENCGLSADDEYQAFYQLNNACVSPILSKPMERLLELKSKGSDYTALYGLKKSDSDNYSRIVLITYGKNGCKVLNFQGDITAETLQKIAKNGGK